jgi:DNA-binding LacI/PurR family transcriptional regulator
VYIHLIELGLRIPDDVSLVSRDTHAVLELGIPELARYRSPTLKLAAHTVRLTQALLAGQVVSYKPHLIIPTFVPGSTLVHPPEI